jgi:hypothetical protein
MSFYITNLVLDIVYGATYWVLNKTSNGIYNLINKNNTNENNQNNTDIIIYQNNINKLCNKIEIQENKIDILINNLQELKDLIKK